MRRGITLIEVLIVVSIVSLLIVITLPAVQSSRESARQAQCKANMAQYGKAFAGYESQRGMYPASVTIRVKGPLLGNSEIYVYNYMAELLPFLGEGGMDAQYHRDALFCAPKNHAVIEQPISIATCPSSPSRDLAPTNTFVPSLLVTQAARQNPIASSLWGVLDKKYSTTFRGSVTDYSVPVEATPGLSKALGYKSESGDIAGLPGMFPWPVTDTKTTLPKVSALLTSSSLMEFSTHRRAADITDGASNTFILTEVAGRPERWQKGIHTGISEPLPSAWADPRTALQLESRDGRAMQRDNEDEIYSFHPNCVNFLFADGHVQTVASNVDLRIVVAWLTPDKGD
jgi:prepilin-type N-terminal cleavage/methylation domain-containing protein/prepilin-type processing-associated H-X9-DG protein